MSKLGATPDVCSGFTVCFMLLIENEKYFADTIAFAKQIGFYEPPGGAGNGNHYLKNRLDWVVHT